MRLHAILARPVARALLALGVLSSASTAQTIPAFPGADGAGASATGGRGGVVYHVTHLDGAINGNRNVNGSLAYGLNDANFTVNGIVQPRTIVFDVGGTIWLGRKEENIGWDTQDPLSVGSQITIAGQTAPGGINIMGGGLRLNGNNAIIRNLVIAPGYGARRVNATSGYADQYTYDAINVSATNVVIDHVSTVFATDETISVDERSNNVTVQYSNISQGQNYPQADAEANEVVYTGHALGSLIQPGQGAAISFHHNLYAHQKGRLPRVGTERPKGWDAKNPGVPFSGSCNDFRNNVFYNWFGTAGTGARGQPSSNNFIGNFYLAGPGGDNPAGGGLYTIVNKPGGTSIFNGANGPTGVYHSGNRKDTNTNGDASDSVELTDGDFPSSSIQGSAFTQVPYFGVTDSAADGYERVLKYVGARWNNRDPIDARIIGEVRTGSGRITALNDPANGTEWNALMALRPKGDKSPFSHPARFDTDQDGMPDTWEIAHGLKPTEADSNGDFDADGYTNLEEYINELAEWPAPRPILWSGGAGRYELINNWDIRWQPSRHDEARINSGRATIDSVGQHANVLKVAADAGTVANLSISDGWIDIANDLIVGPAGSGQVKQTGGNVRAGRSVVLGGPSGAAGVYDLAGGSLSTPRLTRGATGGTFHFTGGVLHADEVTFDLIEQGGRLAPGDGIGHTHIAGDLKIQGGSVAIELASGLRSDTVAVDGLLTLGGSLDITLLGGYRPRAGDRWLIMSAGGITGSFTRITDDFRVEMTGGKLFLVPVSGVPEP
jgi:pectate lyase